MIRYGTCYSKFASNSLFIFDSEIVYFTNFMKKKTFNTSDGTCHNKHKKNWMTSMTYITYTNYRDIYESDFAAEYDSRAPYVVYFLWLQ